MGGAVPFVTVPCGFGSPADWVRNQSRGFASPGHPGFAFVVPVRPERGWPVGARGGCLVSCPDHTEDRPRMPMSGWSRWAPPGVRAAPHPNARDARGPVRRSVPDGTMNLVVRRCTGAGDVGRKTGSHAGIGLDVVRMDYQTGRTQERHGGGYGALWDWSGPHRTSPIFQSGEERSHRLLRLTSVDEPAMPAHHVGRRTGPCPGMRATTTTLRSPRPGVGLSCPEHEGPTSCCLASVNRYVVAE